MPTLDDVLTTIDSNQGAALNRLFELMKIPSVSTDPAFHTECLRAADWLVNDLISIGFTATSVPTTGKPMVLAHAKARRRDVPHVLFYGNCRRALKSSGVAQPMIRAS